MTRQTCPTSRGVATSSLPSEVLSHGDEDVATPFLFSSGGTVEMRPLPREFRYASCQSLTTGGAWVIRILSCWSEEADWPFGQASFPFVVASPTPEALQPIAPGWRVSAYPGKTWKNPSVPRQGYEGAGSRRSQGLWTPPRIEEGRAGCNPCRGRS